MFLMASALPFTCITLLLYFTLSVFDFRSSVGARVWAFGVVELGLEDRLGMGRRSMDWGSQGDSVHCMRGALRMELFMIAF